MRQGDDEPGAAFWAVPGFIVDDEEPRGHCVQFCRVREVGTEVSVRDGGGRLSRAENSPAVSATQTIAPSP